MDIDDEDLYVPEEPQNDSASPIKDNPKVDDLEEGEEEDEGAAMDEDDDDSDIDIITERKDGSKPAPPPQSKYSDIRNIPQRTASNDMAVPSAPIKKDQDEPKVPASLNLAAPSADKTSEAASKSTIDINANPIHPASGKPITHVNIDQDLPENDKPWRKPGTDISDYFNYGFDEFTWALYASKQETIRGEFGADTFAVNNKKMMDDFNMMMMGGMGMPGGGGAGGASGGMPGMDGMPPEVQQMMQQMMASGMDPSQMDPNQMNAMFASMQNGGGGQGGGQGGQGVQGGNFGGGFGGNQGGFYDQSMSGGGGGSGGRGGFGGGRGRRGRW